MYLNDVKLIGNLGHDAEVKTANNQNEYVILSVAVNESWKNKESGDYDTRTDWLRVVVWGKLTNFAKTLKKGETHPRHRQASHSRVRQGNWPRGI